VYKVKAYKKCASFWTTLYMTLWRGEVVIYIRYPGVWVVFSNLLVLYNAIHALDYYFATICRENSEN